MSPDAGLDAVADLVGAAEDLLVITGAGLSADSGLPTYRGVGGLYDDGGTVEGYPIEVALSGGMLRSKPGLCWRYIHQIEAACRGATFNRGHEVLAQLEAAGKRVVVFTQNVDGFHRAAGSQTVIDIHGDIHDLHCTAYGCRWADRVTDYAHLQDLPPRCPDCQGVVRPDVVLFGEMLPVRKLQDLERELRLGFDAVLSIGTSSLFPYIAGPVVDAAHRGLPTVEINPGRSEVTDVVEHHLAMGAAAALDGIATRVGLGPG